MGPVVVPEVPKYGQSSGPNHIHEVIKRDTPHPPSLPPHTTTPPHKGLDIALGRTLQVDLKSINYI